MSPRLGLVVLGCLVVAGCPGGTPYLIHGDAQGADIGYGEDQTTTLPLAKAHCARYERMPRLLQAQQNVAYYQCYKP